MCEPTEWLSEVLFPSPSFFSLLRRLSVSRNPYLLLITGTSTGSPALDLKAPVPRLHDRRGGGRKYDLIVLIVLNWDSEFVLLKFFCFSNPHSNTVFSFLMTYTPTFHTYSIHKIHCFPQKNHLHSSTRFLLLAQCPLKLSHKLCPDLLTQT